MSKKVLIGITALVGLMFVAACGEKKEENKAPAAGGGAGANKPVASTPEAGGEVKVDAATAGTIKGKITFGNKPDVMPKDIPMDAKAKECGTEGKPKKEEYYVVGENDAAANVLVYVKSGPARNVKTPVPTSEVKVDQVNCMYTPRVFGMRAGQPLRFSSSDDTAHNIHLVSRLNSDWNVTMQAKSSFMAGQNGSQAVAAAEMPVSLKCDIHSWMSAFVGVFNHDYFRVTTKDGMYELKDLPPGDYEIEAWHERAKAKPQKVTVGAKETKDLNFVLKFEE